MAQDRACPISPRTAHVLCPGLTGTVLLIVALSLAVACASPTPTPIPRAQEGDNVAVHYHGTLDDGTVFDSSRERDPLEFVVGSGLLIDGFDNAVRGLAVGDTVTVRVEPAEAYGEPIPELIQDIPVDTVPEGVVQGLRIGMMVPISNGMQAMVTNITDTAITLDANHPLAGEALTFEIELVSIASPEPVASPEG